MFRKFFLFVVKLDKILDIFARIGRIFGFVSKYVVNLQYLLITFLYEASNFGKKLSFLVIFRFNNNWKQLRYQFFLPITQQPCMLINCNIFYYSLTSHFYLFHFCGYVSFQVFYLTTFCFQYATGLRLSHNCKTLFQNMINPLLSVLRFRAVIIRVIGH